MHVCKSTRKEESFLGGERKMFLMKHAIDIGEHGAMEYPPSLPAIYCPST